jgi:hypothetical protein
MYGYKCGVGSVVSGEGKIQIDCIFELRDKKKQKYQVSYLLTRTSAIVKLWY